MSGYTWSFNLTPPTATASESRWIFERADVYPLSDTDCLLRNARSGAEAAIRLDVLNALQQCRRFRTLDGHVEAICRAMPALAGQQANVRQVLETLARQGLLRSAEAVLQALQAPVAAAEPPPLEQVYIRTCDRAPLLGRLLDSLAANEARHGGRYRYRVLDDSRDSQARRDTAAQVARLREQGLAVAYHGPEQRQRLFTRLAQALPAQRDALGWLLFGSGRPDARSYGRNWNQALLLGAGRRLLLLDDDAVCQAYAPPQDVEGLELSDRESEWVHFYRDREQALAATARDQDPLARHAELLGRPLSQVLGRCPANALNAAALAELTPEALVALAAAAPVRVTLNSVLGDPGTHSNRWLYLSLDAASRRRFAADEAAYRLYRSQRCLWKGKARLLIAPDTSLMATTLTGLDNRVLLPPTAPELAGEDGLFGAALKFLHPDGLFLHFPWALAHLPEPPRRWEESRAGNGGGLAVLNVLEDLAVQTRDRCRAADPAARAGLLAAQYRDLARAGDAALAEAAASYRLSVRASQIRRLNDALRAFPEAPAWWREDVQGLLQAQVQAQAATDPRALAVLRDTLERYAAALEVWPLAWDWCRDAGAGLLDEPPA